MPDHKNPGKKLTDEDCSGGYHLDVYNNALFRLPEERLDIYYGYSSDKTDLVKVEGIGGFLTPTIASARSKKVADALKEVTQKLKTGIKESTEKNEELPYDYSNAVHCFAEAIYEGAVEYVGKGRDKKVVEGTYTPEEENKVLLAAAKAKAEYTKAYGK